MENKIVQQLGSSGDTLSIAEKYYSVLSAINSLKLTQREIQLVAFTAIRGSISHANVRNDFCEKYATTIPTINNTISKLKKVGMLMKIDGKIKVNPRICLNFEKNILLEINLRHGQETSKSEN